MTEPIAIVGWGGVFPGGETRQTLWSTLCDGVDATSTPPPQRWVLPATTCLDPQPGQPDRVYSTQAGFIRTIDVPWADLRIDPTEVGDPLEHLLLTAGSRAWSSAVTDPLDRRRVGVAVGNIVLPTQGASALGDAILGRAFLRELERSTGVALPEGAPFEARATDRWVAGRPTGILAQALGLGGPQWSLDAACASSLFALELAVRALQAGRIDAALAGGASRPDPLYTQMGFSQLRALSGTGRCSPFDAAADGLVVGEGAGLFVLKRLSDAIDHGDEILAVLTGIGVSNDVDGRLLAPSAQGQLRAMRAAYAEAGWTPSDVDLVECHATGTPTGDAVEFASLCALHQGAPIRTGPKCALGAVKANVGHLLTGAGAAALAKVLLCLEHDTIAPVANFATPSPKVPLSDSPFSIPTEAQPWPADDDRPRRAALSGFGFGGTNAHVLLQDRAPETAKVSVSMPASAGPHHAAVVGLGGRIGPWRGPQSLFARLLGAGHPHEPRPATAFGGLPDPVRGHFIETIEVERGAFGVPPLELEACLPQQILLLDAAESAWHDAGCPDLSGPRTGVYVGVGLDLGTTDYHLRWALRTRAPDWARALGRPSEGPEFDHWVDALAEAIAPALDANRTMGGLGSVVASRVARRFRIGGPSFVLSTEEGSGLAAIDAALDALRRGVIDRALVGAVDVTSDVRALLSAATTTGISAHAFTPALAADADGPVPADGAIAVLLQREAEADQDRVYAVVEGSGGSSGGRPRDFAPDAEAYATSVARALEDADIEADDVGWVVAQGSGRSAADAVEIRGLKAALRRVPTISATTALVGHCGAASGLASVVQACLGIARRVIPGTPGERARRGELHTADTTPRPWLIDRDRQQRRALVAAYGSGGACHHVVLRCGSRSTARTRSLESIPLLPPDAEGLFAVEGDDPADLERSLQRLAAIGRDAPTTPATALARGWAQEHGRRPAARLGLGLIARTGAQLERLARISRTHLDDPDALSKQTAGHVVFTAQPLSGGSRGQLAFVYPGSGSHFPGMGRSLALHFPGVLRDLEDEHKRVHSQVRDTVLWDGTRAEIDSDPRALILGQVSFGTIATRVLQRFGVHPNAAIGYSLGETASLFALGAWHARDEMLRRAEVTPLFSEQLAGPCLAARQAWGLPDDVEVQWMVGVVEADARAVRDALTARDRVALLIVNTPTECVIGGHGPEVVRLAEDLGVRLHRLKGITTVHCDVVGPVAEDYRAFHRLPTTPPPGVRFYSGAWGESYPVDEERAAASITACAVAGIDFPRTIGAAYDDGIHHFVEIGPGASCTRMIDAILGDRPHSAVSMSFAGADERGVLLRALATLLTQRIDVDLAPLHEAPAIAGAPPVRTPHRIPVGRGGHGPLPVPLAIPPVSAATAPRPAAPPNDAALPSVGPALATASAHDAFLRLSATRQRLAATLLGQALPLAEKLPPDLVAPSTGAANEPPPPAGVVLNREQCMEFAVGKIGPVFGPRFASIDAFPTRVRLPDEPLMLVDRVTALEGEPVSLGAGRIVTEHDVRPGSWYLDAGRIPTAVLIESGQADLMLSAWLGIDFETRGESMYRLLDATVTFSGELPKVGQTIRHDIRIERFFQQAGTWLFQFHFESTVDGRPLVSMRDGCAGFFSPQQLAGGQGVVRGQLESARPSASSWTPPTLVDIEPMTMGPSELDALRAGDLEAAFGPRFAGLPAEQPLTIPSGKLRLLDRVTELQPDGGLGLGRIYGEYDVSPDDWFLTCHFFDDHVMPGTLMYECCLHTLRVLLLRQGWVADARKSAFEPVVGFKSRLRCRGQVLPATKVVGYEVIVRRYLESPEPAVVCDARMYADGKWIVDIGDMTVRLSGTTWAELQSRWRRTPAPAPPAELGPDALPAVYDRDRILAFAQGKPSLAFGDAYRPFDDGSRKIARLPRPPFSFIDRITGVTGEPFVMEAGATVEAQVEVPPDAWYFEANRQRSIPLCVLLEMALQPCGWLAAYVGSALSSEQRLRFRNLGGNATLLADVGAGDLLTMRAKLTSVSHAGGMVIQHFDFDVLGRGRESVYRGATYFGFFTDDALREQVGIRDAAVDAVPAGSEALAVPRGAPFPRARLRMVERIDALSLDGGGHGLGFIAGSAEVNPDAWFFEAHFYEDPVWPGSLGLESFLQLLKAWAGRRWSLGSDARFSTAVVDSAQRWSYRGQVTPDRGRVTVQASLLRVDGDPNSRQGAVVEAEGFLSVDGRPIYRIDQLGLRIHGEGREDSR